MLGRTGIVEPTDAEIGDIFVYNRELTQPEIDKVNQLLIHKYGLDVVILPVSFVFCVILFCFVFGILPLWMLTASFAALTETIIRCMLVL